MTIAAIPTPAKVKSTLFPSVAKFVGSGRSKAVRIRAVSAAGEEGEVHREDGSGQAAEDDDHDVKGVLVVDGEEEQCSNGCAQDRPDEALFDREGALLETGVSPREDRWIG